MRFLVVMLLAVIGLACEKNIKEVHSPRPLQQTTLAQAAR